MPNRPAKHVITSNNHQDRRLQFNYLNTLISEYFDGENINATAIFEYQNSISVIKYGNGILYQKFIVTLLCLTFLHEY